MDWYPHREIEKKWQEHWAQAESFRAEDFSKKPKAYVLFEFPYPSGDGLHVGHARPYSAMDAVARKLRMQGKNVLFPIGWDAFGLPTENYALKKKVHPRVATDKNIATFKRQMQELGLSLDWSREIDTTDPTYYRWTQWLFLQFLKHGLAYQAEIPINWCPKDKIGLANEEVIGGKCERCGTEVTRKLQKQWMLKITAYAERLLQDLETVDYPERVKLQQAHWIGKSKGAEIKFKVESGKLKSEEPLQPSLTVFTTRPDTLFGATYLVVAPEHKVIQSYKLQITNYREVEIYTKKAAKKSDLDRTDLAKEKTGVELKGLVAINPGTNKAIPLWVADYVLSSYGTGAIMAVPAHDERDLEFAKKFSLPIQEVVEPLIVRKEGEDAIKADSPLKERIPVVCIVKHWSEDKYLGLRWKKNNWQGFIIGGIEDGEDAPSAGLREILEETGYQHAEYLEPIGGTVHSQFYQSIKKENRFAHFVPLLFKLRDGAQQATAESEQALHDLVWLTPKEMETFPNREDMRLIWDRVQGKGVFTGEGLLTNSGDFSGLPSEVAREKITTWLQERQSGRPTTHFKLRDWVFSRQHYWGEPIPVIHCADDGVVAVPDDQLPVELPHVEKYEPTQTGESPLAAMTDWVDVPCPKCGKPAKRETDTMPNWAGSSWYYLRYCDPKNPAAFAEPEKLRYWLSPSGVDLYEGGMEHTTLHLLYSRFWHKFLFDQKLVPTPEPYDKRRSHGIVLAEDGRKMSKSYGNVINPDDIIREYGADSLRMYELFMGPFEEAIPWSTRGIVGVHRFLQNVHDLLSPESRAGNEESVPQQSEEIERLRNKTVKKVTEDLDDFRFNTAVSSLMEYMNALTRVQHIDVTTYRNAQKTLLLLLFPMAPHLASELWERAYDSDIADESWPTYDESKLKASTVTVIVQVNGKVRAKLLLAAGTEKEVVLQQALAQPNVRKFVPGEPSDVIHVPDKLLNIVV